MTITLQIDETTGMTTSVSFDNPAGGTVKAKDITADLAKGPQDLGSLGGARTIQLFSFKPKAAAAGAAASFSWVFVNGQWLCRP
jgi:hypothetical protein